jgi:hypothetical protein
MEQDAMSRLRAYAGAVAAEDYARARELAPDAAAFLTLFLSAAPEDGRGLVRAVRAWSDSASIVLEPLRLDEAASNLFGAGRRPEWLAEWRAANPERTDGPETTLQSGDIVHFPREWSSGSESLRLFYHWPTVWDSRLRLSEAATRSLRAAAAYRAALRARQRAAEAGVWTTEERDALNAAAKAAERELLDAALQGDP